MEENRNNILEQQMHLIRMSLEHQEKRLKICKDMMLSNKKKMKLYFRRWCNDLLGEKHILSLFNYANFYHLHRLPEYIQVRTSSAGIKGWREDNMNYGHPTPIRLCPNPAVRMEKQLRLHYKRKLEHGQKPQQDSVCEARTLKPFMLCDPI